MRNKSLGRRLSKGATTDQCGLSELLGVGQADPSRVWPSEQRTAPDSFPGTIHPASHSVFARRRPKSHLWPPCMPTSAAPSLPFLPARLSCLFSLPLVGIQGRSLPAERKNKGLGSKVGEGR